MSPSVFHAAMIYLLWLQSRGRRRRMWGRFCQPRRLVLSAVAGVLAVVWLGNSALTVLLRETASPETLRALLSLGLVFYAGWHFAKAALFRPENPFDWTPAELELLIAMPLRPCDLVAYQLASVTVTTILKAGLFTLLLLPDLHCVPLGLLGVLLAMMLLEILRIAIDVTAWGMQRSTYLAYRAVVVAGLVAAGFAVGAAILRSGALDVRADVNDGFLLRLLHILKQLDDSAFGYTGLPFQPFIDLILAENMMSATVGLAATALAAVTGLAAAVIGLYAITSRRVALREKSSYRTTGSARDMFACWTKAHPGTVPLAAYILRLPHLPRFGGAGALLWRQLLGARRRWGSLLTAMIAPLVLTCAPCFIIDDSYVALLATTGTLAFYTFLLLPTALRFDFRRDLDRLATLKSLPIAPMATTVGQTLAPVLIATLFQSGVVAFAVAARSLAPYYFLSVMLVMIPLNVLVFGLDNLIFLLYPYRVEQEGMEIFVRTMLTFTGKGLLFAVGMAAVSAWGFAAAALTSGIARWTGSTLNAYAVFTGGMIIGPSLSAALVLYGVCRTYRSINLIEDIPR